MKDKIIKKIILEIAGQELKLTPQQAKDLYEALAELTGQPRTIVSSPYVPYWTWTYPGYTLYNGSGTVSCYNAETQTTTLQLQ